MPESEHRQTPRTWKAVGEQAGAARAGETMWSGPYLKPGERITAIELEPVLDLLERGSEVIGKLLEALPAGGPAGLELLALLSLANDFANDRDTILRV